MGRHALLGSGAMERGPRITVVVASDAFLYARWRKDNPFPRSGEELPHGIRVIRTWNARRDDLQLRKRSTNLAHNVQAMMYSECTERIASRPGLSL